MEDENPFSKSKTIDPEVRAYIYSLVNALGGTSGDDNGRYVLGDDALAVMRDLKRWLKLYDEKTNRLDVARCLAEANLVRGDLLPIISLWREGEKNEKLRARTALACLEILVPLTWPLEHDEMTVNHHRHTPYILQAQVKYKAACLHWDASPILRQAIRVALPAIAMKREDRTPRDDGIIKLVLYFLRNIAALRQLPNLPSQGLDNEVSRSTTIEEFRRQDVFALLLTLCSNIGDDFNLQDVILLDIIFNLVKGVEVEGLWMSQTQRERTTMSDLKATLCAEADMHRDAKKKAWSRHGRFGTMIWVKDDEKQNRVVSGQDNIKDSRTAMFNIDNTKKWNKPVARRRDVAHTLQDFDKPERLTSTAAEQLRNFVEEFLDSGFNPLVTHLRKAIEREAERLLPINYRQFFYTVSWFLKAERVRRDRQLQSTSSTRRLEPESYSLVAAVLNQETFITLNRYMQISYDEKQWQDLNASMRCFTEILLTVQEMTQSPIEEDQEIAENIQNRIFYEETTHDRIRQILSGYKDQGVGYLDVCTELSHVFLRMLERYSKENVDLQIRSKRKARRKKKAAQAPTDAQDDLNAESEHEDMLDTVQVSRERKFDFRRFSAKFVSQSSVDTFISLLKFYQDLNIEQLKRIHRFLHRVAFKQDMAILLYRIDIIALLYRLIEGPEGMSPKSIMFAEWSEFVKQLLKKMFKKLDERPELAIEMLFSKIPSTLHFLEHGYDKQTYASTRPPAELEVRATATSDRSEQIGIVVTLLVRDGKTDLVEWVRASVDDALNTRHAWEAEAAAREDDSAAVQNSAPSVITLSADTEQVRAALFKNARFRLLNKLAGFDIESHETSSDAVCKVTAHVSASHLEISRNALDLYLVSPWHAANSEDQPEDMLRRMPRERTSRHYDEDIEGESAEAPRDNFINDSEGDEALDLDNEEFLFPDNPRAKRNGAIADQKNRRGRKRKRNLDEETDELDEAEIEERRRKREENTLTRRRKIKSDAYVVDSDEDEEADRAFFEREARLRDKQDAKIKRQMMLDRVAATHDASNKQARPKTSTMAAEEDHLADMGDIAEDTAVSSQVNDVLDSSDVDMEDGTPPSSPPAASDDNEGTPRLKNVSQARSLPERRSDKIVDPIAEAVPDGENASVSEAELMPRVAQRRRGGFVIEDDDDE